MEVYYRAFFFTLFIFALITPAWTYFHAKKKAEQGQYGLLSVYIKTLVALWLSFSILSTVFDFFQARGIPAWQYVKEVLVSSDSSTTKSPTTIPDFER